MTDATLSESKGNSIQCHRNQWSHSTLAKAMKPLPHLRRRLGRKIVGHGGSSRSLMGEFANKFCCVRTSMDRLTLTQEMMQRFALERKVQTVKEHPARSTYKILLRQMKVKPHLCRWLQFTNLTTRGRDNCCIVCRLGKHNVIILVQKMLHSSSKPLDFRS